jgi:hypothetical protein
MSSQNENIPIFNKTQTTGNWSEKYACSKYHEYTHRALNEMIDKSNRHTRQRRYEAGVLKP